MADKKRRARVPVNRMYKVRVIAQPIPTTLTLTTPMNSNPSVPTSTVGTTSTKMPMVKSAAASIPVMVYNLAKGKFYGVPYPIERTQAEENPSIPKLEAIPNAPTFQVREDIPWPITIPASMNLFKYRADWPIPPMQTPSVKVK